MKKERTKQITRSEVDKDTMRFEYDFSKAVRGVTAKRYAQGTNVVVLDPDVVRLFRNATAVNEALRALGGIIRRAPRSKVRKRLTPQRTAGSHR
jgi:Trm5-related predicted tRNA methylase